MRSRSSFRKHVWSCDTSSTSQCGPAPSSEARRFPRAGDDGADDASLRGSTPSSARLSPTFPMCSMSPMTCATSAVVPEERAPSPSASITRRSVSTKAREYDCSASSASHTRCGTAASRAPWLAKDESLRSRRRTSGNACAAMDAQCSPLGPCPSNTPMSICFAASPSSWNKGLHAKQSWLTCAFLSG